MRKEKFFGIVMALITIVFMGCSNAAEGTSSGSDKTGTPIETASITGFVLPEAFETIQSAGNLVTDSDTYTVTSLTWSTSEGDSVNSSYGAGTVYNATVVLTAADEY
jgi:PBP1b-binding outer membrane lipoprotein LpoB